MAGQEAWYSIVAADCKEACANEPDLEARIRKAMKPVAKTHWMFASDHQEEVRFKGALAAVLFDPATTPADKDLITRSMKAAATMGALLNGVPVDLEQALKDNEGCLPLIRMWKDAKEAS